MMLDIAIEADPEWDSSSDWDALVRRAAEAAIAESSYPHLIGSRRAVELSVQLTRDDKVRALNAQWRNKDKETNVLSFPLAEPDDFHASASADRELMLGDIVLAHGVCATEAAEKAIAVEDHATHLVVHGTLHLLGYDHHCDDEAADMEAREVRALARLGIGDPYAESR
jgi:probable rRNA maturation factor